jgi:hypothetical protein
MDVSEFTGGRVSRTLSRIGGNGISQCQDMYIRLQPWCQ